MEVGERASTKLKSMWALYGAIAISLVNVGVQVLQIFFKQ
jgi:hypothetical protein